MGLNSYQFVFIFLPIVVGGYWYISTKYGGFPSMIWLLAASLAFYITVSPISLWILMPSILLDYVLALLMLRVDLTDGALRNAIFLAGVLANILFLAYFKYRNFVLDNVNTVLSTHFSLSPLALPLGISFLVFQKIAFLADVHSGEVKRINAVGYFLFMLFYPRAAAGPIVRYSEITPQFHRSSAGNTQSDLIVGLSLFSLGIFKKCVIADNVALYVPDAFDSPSLAASGIGSPPLLTAWVGLLAFNFQLYFDFSGYSDMALGAARMIGVRLPMNFNSPFKSRSIVEFWSRWHMTLTRFLTMYIYTPLVIWLTRRRMRRGREVLRGKRTKLSAILTLVAAPTMVTMTVSGLWHGAAWTFVIYGLLHGLYLSANQAWRMLGQRVTPWLHGHSRLLDRLGLALTLFSVVIAQVFFRADSLHSAFLIFRGLVGLNGIWPIDIQLLDAAGIRAPHAHFADFFPFTAFLWLGILLFIVLVLPNSLELLRSLEPALDFPGAEAKNLTKARIDIQHGTEGLAPPASPRIWGRAIAAFHNLGKMELLRDGITTAAIAILGVLGLMALTRGSGFVYGRF